MRFVELVAVSAAVAATSGRRAKVELLAGALRGLAPNEIAAGSAYLAGEVRQRQTGVGFGSLRDLPPPAAEPTLTVAQVDAAIAAIAPMAGVGSQARRRDALGALFGAATADEQRLLVDLFVGGLRQGAQAGLLADAVAVAAGVPLALVRRALLLAGDLKAVAEAALTGGAAALAGFTLQVGRPLAPMLAQSAPSIEDALAATGAPAVVDGKLDGIRIQVHRSGRDVAIFSRSLDEITPRMPAVIAAVLALPVREMVLDGEGMVLDPAGRPQPFQVTAGRAATRGARRGVTAEVAAAAASAGAAGPALNGAGDEAADQDASGAAGLADDGASGAAGLAEHGASGAAGAAGLAEHGASGVAGLADDGASGAAGLADDGAPGDAGLAEHGTSGVAGPTGRGASAVAGPAEHGASGVAGLAEHGAPGATGPAHPSGAPGRAGRDGDADAVPGGVEAALTPYFFDLLHLDGGDLLDAPGRERWAALADVVPPALLVPRAVAHGPEEAHEAFAAALATGLEGVVIKSPEAAYDVGRRGSAWVKVKPRHTLDLVVLAVEWGSGRRTGWLSNLHLGARDPVNGGFVMLGKTFKGMTDEMLRWQTERFQELAVDRGDWVVRVRPEQVVEIAFDGVQRSTRYAGGVALRFARVLRYRDDKTAAEADTIDTVRAIHARGALAHSPGDQSAASDRT